MKTVINATETTVNKRNVNKAKNSSKLAQSKLSRSLEKSINALDELSNTLRNKKPIETKGINLLNEAKKETNKRNKLETVKNKTKGKASYNNCVLESNRLLKDECIKLGYAITTFLMHKDKLLTNRPISDKFTEYDKIKITAMFEIAELSKKDSKLYKFIESIPDIKSKKGKFSAFKFQQKLFNEKREIMLTKYVNSNMQEREIFTFE